MATPHQHGGTDAPECTTCSSPNTRVPAETGPGEEDRRAPVNGAPYGTIAWPEHVEAWEAYHRRFSDQDADTIARRGGFGIEELTSQLGRLPETWRPNTTTESWWRRFR